MRYTVNKIPNSRNLSYRDNKDKFLVLTSFRLQSVARNKGKAGSREEFVDKQGSRSVTGMFTVACLVAAQFDSVRLRLY